MLSAWDDTLGTQMVPKHMPAKTRIYGRSFSARLRTKYKSTESTWVVNYSPTTDLIAFHDGILSDITIDLDKHICKSVEKW